ncbi:MAG: acyl carrier protein [Bacteroidota bacterium]|jgi:acyl carrier protein
MSREIILQQVTDIFRDVLDNNNIVLTDNTVAKDIPEWDSLNHIQLVVAVEKKFSIRFTALEIQSWTNVGGMIDSLVVKTQSSS